MSPYMNVQECAEYTRLKLSTIYKMAHLKEIPYRKHGSRLIFHKDDIDAWSASQATPVENKKTISKFRETQQRILHHGNRQT